jgi:hypothetical protein
MTKQKKVEGRNLDELLSFAKGSSDVMATILKVHSLRTGFIQRLVSAPHYCQCAFKKK